MYKILIVEDDMVIAKGLASHLQQWGYDAVYVEDFKNVKDKFLECDPQLVLLDVILPYFNGFHWCQEIRKVSKVPIVFYGISRLWSDDGSLRRRLPAVKSIARCLSSAFVLCTDANPRRYCGGNHCYSYDVFLLENKAGRED